MPIEANQVELPSFRAPAVYVHARIPPCDTLGHKADLWNVAKPDFSCSMFCCTKGDMFIIRLLTDKEETFAESFWKPDRPMSSVIDAAADSSRYFALRVENPETGAHHFLGIGFGDRETSGQFKLTLSEHGKYIQRMKKAQSQVLQPEEADNHLAPTSPSSSAAAAVTQQPERDLSLKGSIRVTLPNLSEKRGLMAKLDKTQNKAGLQIAMGPQGGLLPPPPGRQPPTSAGLVVAEGQTASPLNILTSTGNNAYAFVPFPSPELPSALSGDMSCTGTSDADFGDFCGAD